MRLFFTSLLLLTLSSQVLAKVALDESAWKTSFNKDGVKIYSQKVQGQDIIAFRTIYTVDASVIDMLRVLRDAKGGMKWNDDLKTVEYISEPSDLEATIYEVRKFPWPFEDRDLIVHYLLSINKEKKSISVKFNSVKHKKRPKVKGKVRARLHYGLMEFWPEKDKTKIELTVLADPAGAIPAWVVNILQEKMPFKYIKTLETQAKKLKSKKYPGLAQVIEEYYQLYPETTVSSTN